MKKLYSNKWVILSLVLPGLLLFFFAIFAPICLSVYYGFTDYSGMGSYHFIGFDNYKALFHDKAFGLSLRNSLLLLLPASACHDRSSRTRQARRKRRKLFPLRLLYSKRYFRSGHRILMEIHLQPGFRSAQQSH